MKIMEYVTLKNGVKMPVLGYGVFQISEEECARCVSDALEVGYRSIDTAQYYKNESAVGKAVAESGISREDIFITSKIWPDHYGYENCKNAVMESLKMLQTDYIDLMLLHQPFEDFCGAWSALEDLYETGVVKAIGVSNFYGEKFQKIEDHARIMPMVNQIELHPYNQQGDFKKKMEEKHIQTEAWAPFGEGKRGMFEDELLKRFGTKYGKSTAQIMLRWHIQNGVVVIPKTTHKERMVENLDVFDFKLSEEEMQEIAGLDTGESSFNW